MPTTQLITATSKWFGFTDPQEDFLGKQEITNAISEVKPFQNLLLGYTLEEVTQTLCTTIIVVWVNGSR